MNRVLTRLGVVGAATVLAGGLAVGLAPSAAMAAGCAGFNHTDVSIPDVGTSNSAIVISGCTGKASAASTVEVHLVHYSQGALVVSLIAPDGSAYLLHNRSGGTADNLDATYPVNLSTETADGSWQLRVQDAVTGEAGFINTWTLTLGVAPLCSRTNDADTAVPDNGTVTSAVAVTGCAGNGSATASVAVNIVHTYSGDLVVSLVAPDRSVYILQNRSGGSADNIVKTFTVNLSSEARNGVWGLRVQDAAGGDRGYINSWTLSL
ncbi:proprotein convertase P-domain-containing protein [Catellatospora methionotrophica]|uniref:proprotein convertase P-domain-containing protein n=1 Tax=Catellatospora methionotrophica TaxID=121620 RepID=UPI0033EB2B38